MEIIIRRRDIYVVTALLVAFLSWVAIAQYENHAMRADLRELASSHVDEWFASEPEDTKREDFEFFAIVDSERTYELFGPTYGVVHVYIRERGDVDCKTFKGIEYFYRGEEGRWTLEDSAGCSAKEHHVRAFETYLSQGYGVDETVIDSALGVDFDVAQLRARVEIGHLHTSGDGHTHAAEETAGAPEVGSAQTENEDEVSPKVRREQRARKARRNHEHDDHGQVDHQQEGATAQ